MGIKAHCMGMEFPKPIAHITHGDVRKCIAGDHSECETLIENNEGHFVRLPSAADLDAVAEEQKAKEQTSGKTQS